MPIQYKYHSGSVHISDEVVAALAGSAALECYGLVGMASRKQLKDGIAELLGRDNLSKGIVVRSEEDQTEIDLHIIVSYGTKISEVAHNVQTRVKYVLSEIAGIHVHAVHIFVQGVRVAT